jgi:Cft2 family RNA processing exonuclease
MKLTFLGAAGTVTGSKYLIEAGASRIRVYITHGEHDAADALRRRIQRVLGWQASVPMMGDVVELPMGLGMLLKFEQILKLHRHRKIFH